MYVKKVKVLKVVSDRPLKKFNLTKNLKKFIKF